MLTVLDTQLLTICHEKTPSMMFWIRSLIYLVNNFIREIRNLILRQICITRQYLFANVALKKLCRLKLR